MTPQTPEEAYTSAAELLQVAIDEALRQVAAMAKQREAFDDFQKQVHGESYLFLAQALTELGRYDEAIEVCDRGAEVTKYALLRSQKRIAERRRDGDEAQDDQESIAEALNRARRDGDAPAPPAPRNGSRVSLSRSSCSYLNQMDVAFAIA